MKIKTAGLIDTALDWAVAECNYVTCYFDHKGRLMEERGDLSWVYAPSTDWAQGGPIIERECIDVMFEGPEWYAYMRYEASDGYNRTLQYDGQTPLIAAMRCYVASKLGDEVDVPDELCQA